MSTHPILTLNSGWTNDEEESPYVRITNDGEVLVKGVVRDEGGVDTRTITVLPEGYRPKDRLSFQCEAEGYATVRVDILPSGEVLAYDTVPNRLSLTALRFEHTDEPAPKTKLPVK